MKYSTFCNVLSAYIIFIFIVVGFQWMIDSFSFTLNVFYWGIVSLFLLSPLNTVFLVFLRLMKSFKKILEIRWVIFESISFAVIITLLHRLRNDIPADRLFENNEGILTMKFFLKDECIIFYTYLLLFVLLLLAKCIEVLKRNYNQAK